MVKLMEHCSFILRSKDLYQPAYYQQGKPCYATSCPPVLIVFGFKPFIGSLSSKYSGGVNKYQINRKYLFNKWNLIGHFPYNYARKLQMNPHFACPSRVSKVLDIEF